MFCYSVVNLLRIAIHYSKYSKSVQNVVIHYLFSSESLRVVNSLQIVNSLRVLFLVCRGPLGTARVHALLSSFELIRASIALTLLIFIPLLEKSRRLFWGPKMRFLRWRKSLANRDFSAMKTGKFPVKMILTAEFLAMPSSAVKIASERRCAILVHSGQHQSSNDLAGIVKK